MVLALLGHSSWQLPCLLMPLHSIPLKLHCDQQQRIQPLPVFWLACESATDRTGSHGFLMVFQRYVCRYSLPVALILRDFPRQAVASTRSGEQKRPGQ